MEDWQGCLSPACQAALQNARDSVIRRGGYAVTIEDFLLSMLDEIPTLNRFLQRQGVDLDELTRTIQCEQPIVTAVASDNLLSSQLTYWIYCAHQMTGSDWLEWPELLKTLVSGADRLREKAYVAVLELVGHWPRVRPGADANFCSAPEPIETVKPCVVADEGWARLCEDVCVAMSAQPKGLFWLAGVTGSGKSSWLESVVTTLPGGAVIVDIRREADVLASEQAAFSSSTTHNELFPVLVLDNVSPVDLMTLLGDEFSIVRELVTSFPGPILLLSPEPENAQPHVDRLQSYLGRQLEQFRMPDATTDQKAAILAVHQPFIEKRWQLEFAPGVLEHAAKCRNPLLSTPGRLLQWVEATASRLHLFAERGPAQASALAGKMERCRRQLLLAMARHQPMEPLNAELEALAIERAATEVAWHERKRTGSLRLLTFDDLTHELDLRVAAVNRASHYSHKSNEPLELELA
ncbi:hypothetical protein [Marinobacter sp. CHS3-4]|uniref:hypothetical protein n=1 Tax=Marinobacter sp. CHS3-4 TaxID=3045174 RepID=UPI0024B4C930|nr:hypothetical protein [Marinobacter sp. CHS3-4]MDI9245088.1 hypothetical protein [Marinobacter sp. CHS3-4]